MFMNFKTLTVTHRNLLSSLICFIINLIVEGIVCWTNQHKPSQAHLHLLELFGGVWQALLLGGGRPEGNSHSAHEPLLVRVHLHHLAEPEVTLPHLPVILEEADISLTQIRHLHLPFGQGEEGIKCLVVPKVPPEGEHLVHIPLTAGESVFSMIKPCNILRAGGSPSQE